MKKIGVCLSTLEAALLTIGDELRSIKFRQDLLCHAGFQHIYITAAPYNELEYSWKSIKAHVMGAWNTAMIP
jgi:hypothetical protein